MRYSDDPIYGTLADVVGDIARVATNGDCKAAMADLVAAAADGAIKARAALKKQLGTDKLTNRLGLEPIPAWVWQCVRRGQARISDDECEIVIKGSDPKTQEPLTLRYYDIWFEWYDIAFVWPEPKPKHQSAATQGGAAPQSAEELATSSQPAATASKGAKPRAAYRNELRTYLAPRDIAPLVRQGKDAIAAEFTDYCRREKPELFAKLPKAREVANQVQRILDSRRARPQTSSASNRPEPQSPASNRS